MRTVYRVLTLLAALALGEELATAEGEGGSERTGAPCFVATGATGHTEVLPLAVTEALTDKLLLELHHGVLSRSTSVVAADEVLRRTDPDLENVTRSLPLPRGVSRLTEGGSVPTTPEPETWLLISAVASVLGTAALRRGLR